MRIRPGQRWRAPIQHQPHLQRHTPLRRASGYPEGFQLLFNHLDQIGTADLSDLRATEKIPTPMLIAALATAPTDKFIHWLNVGYDRISRDLAGEAPNFPEAKACAELLRRFYHVVEILNDPLPAELIGKYRAIAARCDELRPTHAHAVLQVIVPLTSVHGAISKKVLHVVADNAWRAGFIFSIAKIDVLESISANLRRRVTPEDQRREFVRQLDTHILGRSFSTLMRRIQTHAAKLAGGDANKAADFEKALWRAAESSIIQLAHLVGAQDPNAEAYFAAKSRHLADPVVFLLMSSVVDELVNHNCPDGNSMFFGGKPFSQFLNQVLDFAFLDLAACRTLYPDLEPCLRVLRPDLLTFEGPLCHMEPDSGRFDEAFYAAVAHFLAYDPEIAIPGFYRDEHPGRNPPLKLTPAKRQMVLDGLRALSRDDQDTLWRMTVELVAVDSRLAHVDHDDVVLALIKIFGGTGFSPPED